MEHVEKSLWLLSDLERPLTPVPRPSQGTPPEDFQASVVCAVHLVDKEQAAEWRCLVVAAEDKGLAPLTVMGGGEEMPARHVQHQETRKIFSGCEMLCAGE